MGIKIGNTDISKIKIASGLTPRLPAEYQEVEYIESSGTQYINTGWYPSSNYCKVVMDGTVYSGNNSWSVFFGMTNGSNAYSLHTDHYTWQLNVGSVTNRGTGISFVSGTDGIFTFEANNGSISVDIAGSTYTGTYSGSVAQSTRQMYIFAFNENGSTTWETNMKVREFKIYSDASTLARDFIPCYRIADSVIGMYDLITDTFYTNSGSGTFTKGTNVGSLYKDIKKVYLGNTQVRPSGWTPGANTVGYRPLTSATEGADQSGNGYDLSGTYRTFGTYAGVDCVYVTGGGNSDIRLYNSSIPISTTETGLAWFYCTDTSNGAKGVMSLGNDWEHDTIGGLLVDSTNTPLVTDWYSHDEYGTGSYTNSWHLMAVTYDGTTAILYIDGVENVRYNFTRTSGVGIAFSHKASYISGRFSERFTGYLSEAIYENKVRTAEEVADYFNSTKSNYTQPSAEYTDRSQDMYDLVQQAINDSGGVMSSFIEILYGAGFEADLDSYLSGEIDNYQLDDLYSPISGGGLEISDGGDMTDITVQPNMGGYSDAICIVADYDYIQGTAQYVQGTDLGNDEWSFDLSNYASSYSGLDTVLLFIFK